jgi:hypothetical protein
MTQDDLQRIWTAHSTDQKELFPNAAITIGADLETIEDGGDIWQRRPGETHWNHLPLTNKNF